MKGSFRQPSILPGFGLTLGFTTFFLSAIVLIPLAALVMKTATMGWREFVAVLLNPRAVASYRLSFGGAMLAAAINSVTDSGNSRTPVPIADSPSAMDRNSGTVKNRPIWSRYWKKKAVSPERSVPFRSIAGSMSADRFSRSRRRSHCRKR